MKLNQFSDILSIDDFSLFDACDVSGISCDSRSILSGNLFFALSGSQSDGASYLSDAEKRGALALVVSPHTKIDESCRIPFFRVDDPRRALALCAARFSGKQPETLVAVTGTSGKTSVTSFLRQIWSYVGKSAASIGTTGVFSSRHDSVYSSFPLTTPHPVELHKILSNCEQSGVTHVVMEASSHGLDQHRLDGVRLSAGAFTNLGHDHMDYHKGIEDYLTAKLRLFKDLLPQSSPAVIFADDVFSSRVIDVARFSGLKVLTVGRSGTFLQLKRVEHGRFRQRAEILFDQNLYEIDVPLAGDFQICNALISAGLAVATGIALEQVFQSLKILKGEKGRLECVGTTQTGASVYVDYAHKPEALASVLSALRPFTTGRLIVVFGCGGNRDSLKRPIMGEISARLADISIVTDDNPRHEAPAEIRASILRGAPDALEIADRREAIFTAVGLLQAGDTLVIAGKGHEEGQIFGDLTLAFSDQEEAQKALKEIHL